MRQGRGAGVLGLLLPRLVRGRLLVATSLSLPLIFVPAKDGLAYADGVTWSVEWPA